MLLIQRIMFYIRGIHIKDGTARSPIIMSIPQLPIIHFINTTNNSMWEFSTN